MPQRVSRVIHRNLPAGLHTVDVDVPAGEFKKLILTFDRTRFETSIRDDQEVCRIGVYDRGHYCGGATWAGGVIDGTAARPGQRRLWSYLRISHLPWAVTQVNIEVECAQRFFMSLDVDFWE